MHIMPFGCQSWVVKPPHAISKTNIAPKASDVYFAESVFPRRPAGDRTVGDVTPSVLPRPDADDDQPPGVPDVGAPDATSVPPPRPGASIAAAFADATGRRRASRESRKVLVLSSPAHTHVRMGSAYFSPKAASTSRWVRTTLAMVGTHTRHPSRRVLRSTPRSCTARLLLRSDRSAAVQHLQRGTVLRCTHNAQGQRQRPSPHPRPQASARSARPQQ
eukprot:1911076-Prymnesium_polylepis.1